MTNVTSTTGDMLPLAFSDIELGFLMFILVTAILELWQLGGTQ
jgi:hypothetical protein